MFKPEYFFLQACESSGFPARGWPQTSVVFNDKMWGGWVGSSNSDILNDVWSSSDGAIWIQVKPNDDKGFSKKGWNIRAWFFK